MDFLVWLLVVGALAVAVAGGLLWRRRRQRQGGILATLPSAGGSDRDGSPS